MAKKVNVVKGKQGFQRTVSAVPVPTPSPEPVKREQQQAYDVPPLPLLADIVSRRSTTRLLDEFTDEQLHSIYSGSDCHQLARWFVEEDPERFTLWSASVMEDGRLLPSHWFVEDKQREVFIDIYGDSSSPEHLMSEWEDFQGIDIVYRSHEHAEGIKLAEKTMGCKSPAKKNMPSIVHLAFSPEWSERAGEAVERLGLLR